MLYKFLIPVAHFVPMQRLKKSIIKYHQLSSSLSQLVDITIEDIVNDITEITYLRLKIVSSLLFRSDNNIIKCIGIVLINNVVVFDFE